MTGSGRICRRFPRRVASAQWVRASWRSSTRFTALAPADSTRACAARPRASDSGLFALRAQWFFSDSTGVEQFVEEFAKKNKDIFDLEAEEHKLEYTEVYKKFQDSFEQKIEVRAARWPTP